MSSGTSLEPLWAEARRAIAVAEEVVVIGYSFPPTDTQAAGLFLATVPAVCSDRRIEIVNPHPESATATLRDLAQVPANHAPGRLWGMDFIMDALVGRLESEGDTGLNQ